MRSCKRTLHTRWLLDAVACASAMRRPVSTLFPRAPIQGHLRCHEGARAARAGGLGIERAGAEFCGVTLPCFVQTVGGSDKMVCSDERCVLKR